MNDNPNDDKNQSFEGDIPRPIKVEEVSPGVQNPDEMPSNSADYPEDLPPIYEENKNKYVFIAGGVIFFLLIFGAIYFFFLRGESGSPNGNNSIIPQSNEPVTLTYWGLWEDVAIFQPLIDEYQEENPHVTINYEKRAPDQYREQLLARSTAGTGPDIYRFHNTWVPELKDIMTPLPAEIMSNEEFENTFYPIHQKDLNIESRYYGLPLMIDGLVLIYNEDILNHAGISAPPNSWIGDSGDVLTTVNSLTVKDTSDNIVTSGMAIGTANNIEHFGEMFGVLLLLNGGNLDELDQIEAAEALQLYRKFAEDNYWNEQMPNSITAFIEGRVAMILAPSWQIFNIKAQNPELNIKVAEVPRGLDNTQLSIASYWVEGVNRNSPNQVEAWKFLKFLTENESQTKLFENQSKVRLFGYPYSRKDLGETLKQNPYLAPVITQAENDAFYTLPLADRTFDNGLNEEVLQYLVNAINSTAEGVDYSVALKTAHTGIQEVYKKYGLIEENLTGTPQ